MSRTQFFREACHYFLKRGLATAERFTPQSTGRRYRPPGAISDERQFLKKCSGCDACMAACPVHVIMVDTLERRDPWVAKQSNCIQCPGTPCISSCPTGALDKKYGNYLRLVKEEFL